MRDFPSSWMCMSYAAQQFERHVLGGSASQVLQGPSGMWTCMCVLLQVHG
jgi:hypothetical protein